MAQLPSYDLRDVSRGVIRPSAINNALVPPNSVSFARNFYFDTIIGSAVVRPGTTLLGAQVAANKSCLGIFEFVTGGQVKNYVLSVFTGAANASIYYYDGSWHTSGVTNLSNTARCRFDMLNGYCYLANGTDSFQYSNDGFATTNMFSFSGSSPVTIKPSLIIQAMDRLILSGATQTNRSRVYFSSIVDPTGTPGITINTDASTGDWVDVNPDDGDDNTAFAYTSGLVIVFKRNAMYRLDAINKTVDLKNVFDFGAPSQEAVTTCQGQVYFFTGRDIRMTNGSFPTQISRLGVQDFINAISQSNWTSVYAGNDGNNVFFSIGNVTIPSGGNTSVTYSNVVLKFSVLDQNWTILTYPTQQQAYCLYTESTNGRKMRFGDGGGNVQTTDVGVTDNGTPIYYELWTQPLDFQGVSQTEGMGFVGNARYSQKRITEDVAVYTRYAAGSTLEWRTTEDDNFKPVPIDLDKRVNVPRQGLEIQGNYFTFRIIGQTTNKSPIFEGMSFGSIDDLGIQEQI